MTHFVISFALPWPHPQIRFLLPFTYAHSPAFAYAVPLIFIPFLPFTTYLNILSVKSSSTDCKLDNIKDLLLIILGRVTALRLCIF